jgi:D-3-phosphoglycerate dehydrogenase
MKILVTCPPMLRQLDHLTHEFEKRAWSVTAPEVVQTLTVEELCQLVPEHDGWIIGDDPANATVVDAAAAGQLKAAVKWGVGIDNVDFDAFAQAQIPITHTPGMFGAEVADIALGYLIGLARHTFEIHREVQTGNWPKPTGTSIAGKTVGLVGYGDIGRQLFNRLLACGLNVVVYDPAIGSQQFDDDSGAVVRTWPADLEGCDFLCFTCALTDSNFHMLGDQELRNTRPGLRIVNVARGPLIVEQALISHLKNGQVAAAALDVFEDEPLPGDNELRDFPQNVFGSHNASNTLEAVLRTSHTAIELLAERLP